MDPTSTPDQDLIARCKMEELNKSLNGPTSVGAQIVFETLVNKVSKGIPYIQIADVTLHLAKIWLGFGARFEKSKCLLKNIFRRVFLIGVFPDVKHSGVQRPA